MKGKHLLGIKDLQKDDILKIFYEAKKIKFEMENGKRCFNELNKKTIATVFYENSTRTRVSFELAAKYIGATTVDLGIGTSSVNKGESLIDTVETIKSMYTDAVVLRHSTAGAAEYLSQKVDISVLNAGDGCNEHPTQALLDMFTMLEECGSFDNLKVAIVGDLQHSRVARSNIWGLNKFGVKPYIYAPKTLCHDGFGELEVVRCKTLNEAIKDADVVMTLRIQLERQEKGLLPSLKEYAKFYGLNGQNIKYAKPNVIVMHPAPINRDVEITSQLADSKNSVINRQVTNGLYIRMAALKLLLKGE